MFCTVEADQGYTLTCGFAGNPYVGGLSHRWSRGGGFQRVLGGDAPILVPDSGGCESVAVDLEQVVDGAHESPLT
jgi:hypothetical protein